MNLGHYWDNDLEKSNPKRPETVAIRVLARGLQQRFCSALFFRSVPPVPHEAKNRKAHYLLNSKLSIFYNVLNGGPPVSRTRHQRIMSPLL
jgi:hypothetical protein